MQSHTHTHAHAHTHARTRTHTHTHTHTHIRMIPSSSCFGWKVHNHRGIQRGWVERPSAAGCDRPHPLCSAHTWSRQTQIFQCSAYRMWGPPLDLVRTDRAVLTGGKKGREFSKVIGLTYFSIQETMDMTIILAQYVC